MNYQFITLQFALSLKLINVCLQSNKRLQAKWQTWSNEIALPPCISQVCLENYEAVMETLARQARPIRLRVWDWHEGTWCTKSNDEAQFLLWSDSACVSPTDILSSTLQAFSLSITSLVRRFHPSTVGRRIPMRLKSEWSATVRECRSIIVGWTVSTTPTTTTSRLDLYTSLSLLISSKVRRYFVDMIPTTRAFLNGLCGNC